MGALHEGHASLVRRARQECASVAVSIFVNPTQFGPHEDFARYPRTPDVDLRLLESLGVDVVIIPDADEMYPAGHVARVTMSGYPARGLEAAARPGHFNGVATVVAKLFAIVAAQRAYFGQKDAQQLAVVRRMVTDLDIDVEVVGCPTVREPDGLAMSSRNRYLSPDERRSATVLYRGLCRAREAWHDGERSPGALRRAIVGELLLERVVRPEYAAIVHPDTFRIYRGRVDGPALAAVAARVGTTRLIDNASLD